MSTEPLTLLQLVELIDEPHRHSCTKLYSGNKRIILQSPGSQRKHQAWIGGYVDHLEETMNFAIDLYEMMQKKRPLPFALSDALLVLFLHDIEKPFKYVGNVPDLDTEKSKWDFLIKRIIPQYHFELTTTHMNALEFVHGEGDKYDPHKRVQKPLAAFVHICDVTSARIWHDYPLKAKKTFNVARNSNPRS